MSDLNEAIRLSAGVGRTGCRALCQRGLLWRRSDAIEAAKADFARAARLGSKFARSQVSLIIAPLLLSRSSFNNIVAARVVVVIARVLVIYMYVC